MLQRIQTLWLFLASILTFLSLNFEFFSGVKTADNVFHALNGKENLIILVLTVANAVALLITIFLYKNRKLQLRIGLITLAISILIIVLYFMQVKNYSAGSYSLWSVFSFAVPVLLVMALRGIYKDALVKKLNRLR